MKPISILNEDHENLFEAAMNLEITVLDCQKLIFIGDKARIACWTYNTKTKEEKIIVGPEGLKLSSGHLDFVLRHELLHKFSYKGPSSAYYDQLLLTVS